MAQEKSGPYSTNDFLKIFRKNLLLWYRKNKRDLPWRKTRDPYVIWVSEIMLQQTQVATVIPYFQKFLRRFPTLEVLARAPEEEVLAQWAGLGYYRRAKLLQAGARFICEQLNGNIPSTREALLEIPGIGPYTAGAIASIAFQKPEALVDGNVVRVFSRIFRLKGHAKDAALQKKIWKHAAELVDPQFPGDFNQALMELGATLCRPALPSCPRCPVRAQCLAQGEDAENYPETPPATQTIQLKRAVALIWRDTSLLLVKRKESRWFQGLWELPHEYFGEIPQAHEALNAYLESSLGISLKKPEARGVSTHGITHHKISSHAFSGKSFGQLKPADTIEKAQYFPLDALQGLALPNFDRKVLEAAKVFLKDPR